MRSARTSRKPLLCRGQLAAIRPETPALDQIHGRWGQSEVGGHTRRSCGTTTIGLGEATRLLERVEFGLADDLVSGQ